MERRTNTSLAENAGPKGLTLRELVETGELPCYPRGRRLCVRGADVDAYVERWRSGADAAGSDATAGHRG